MTLTMYDSTTAADIYAANSNPDVVAGYAFGTYAWDDADWALFPNADKFHITPNAYYLNADILDVETGDVSPTDSKDIIMWVQNSNGAKIVYCGLENWALIRTYFPVNPPLWWVAHYTGEPTIPPGAWGIQYANQPITGGHYDLSAIQGDPMTDPNAVLLPRESITGGAQETGETSVDNMVQYEDSHFDSTNQLINAGFTATSTALAGIDTQLTALTAAVAALTAKVAGLNGNLSITVSGTLTGVPNAN
jgi:hypothetical protein